MEKYLENLIERKGLNEGYKECVYMIESLMYHCHMSNDDKLIKINTLIQIIVEAEYSSGIMKKENSNEK